MNTRTFVPRLGPPTAALLAVLFCATSAFAQQPLTLRDAIRRALGQSPQAAIAQADAQQARASASLAGTARLPQLHFDEDISRGNDPVYAFGTRLRQGQFTQADFALNALNRPQPVGNFASRLSGSWLAFDSFKTQRTIRAADLARKSAGSAAKAADQKIVLDVVEAYEGVLFAERQLAVAEHEQQTAAALLKQVSDRVHAGLAVDSDLMSAQVNAAARKQELIAAQGGVQLAWAQLRLAMGAPDLPESTIEPIEPRTFPAQSLDEELAAAAKSRPDLRALGQAQSAQSAAVGAARSDFGPRISAYGNWEADRPTFTGSGGNHWVAGAQLTLDILPIGKRAELDRQKAAKQRVTAELEAARQRMQLQVSRAHIQRQTAQLSLATAQAAMTQSAESLRILGNRYGAGLATITDLLRAEDAERQAQANYWQAVYANSMAYAQLLFATGTLTPDAAEVLQ
ncbi:MAG TPA: TolC family protein [Terracidiphilus sp.]|nr:TolC family protein [Terracidiphilus sp.]